MHVYHIAFESKEMESAGDAIVQLDHRILSEDLENIRANLKSKYGYTEQAEVIITFIYKLGDS